MRRFLSIVVGASLLMAATAASADTFVWKDPAGAFTASFPDSWSVKTSDHPATRLRVVGPIAEDWASCKVKAETDGRLKIYPKKYMDEAVGETLNSTFWENETGQFKNAEIRNFYGPASLGDKGDATAVHVAFLQDDGKGGKMPMYGMMIASLYGDKLYVASCTAKHDQFVKYAPLFGSILDSIRLDDRYHPFETGYYRNFLLDAPYVPADDRPGTRDASLPVPKIKEEYNR